jgi:hypothetical protein
MCPSSVIALSCGVSYKSSDILEPLVSFRVHISSLLLLTLSPSHNVTHHLSKFHFIIKL